MFWFKNSNIFTFFGCKQLRLCETSSPALEKSCSDGTDVAVMQYSGKDKYKPSN